MNAPDDMASGPDLERHADDLGCGESLLALHVRLRDLAPDALLRVLARDPGAEADPPSWCETTGRRLVSAAPPT